MLGRTRIHRIIAQARYLLVELKAGVDFLESNEDPPRIVTTINQKKASYSSKWASFDINERKDHIFNWK